MQSTLLFVCVGMTMVPVTQMSSRGLTIAVPRTADGTTRGHTWSLGSSREGLEGV